MILIAVVVHEKSPSSKNVVPANYHTLNVVTSAPLVELAANATIAEIRSRAEQGDKEAQFRLGEAYDTGAGVGKDSLEAMKWYRKAAEQGHAEAEYNLGVHYELGEAVSKDYAEAVMWYLKAAEQGLAAAQNYLGMCYHDGVLVTRDDVEAARWYRKAAEQEFAFAQFNLGRCYHKGEGVRHDDVEAVKWFRKAAELGFVKAQTELGYCYNLGEGVPQDDGEAVKWYRKAAEQGDAGAEVALGSCYSDGAGVSKDDIVAAQWYRKAAEKGNAEAQSSYGWCYHKGEGVRQDDVEAVKWFRKAAEQGHAEAQYRLGICYDYSVGVPKDIIEATKWFILAAAQQAKLSEKSLNNIEKEMTREQFAEAQRRADEFKRQHADVTNAKENPTVSTVSTQPKVKTDEQLRHLTTDGRLNSGTVLVDHLQAFEGKGTLTLDNGLAEDAFVKMISNEKLVASFYVRGGERFTFDHVPDGLYKLIYCTGFGWDANGRDFARGRHAVRYDEALNYATTRRNEGTTIITSTGVITLTLHKVANGNAKTTGIPLAEFDQY